MSPAARGGGSLTVAAHYTELGRWQDALDVVGPILSTQPDNVLALLILGECRLGLNDPEAALQAGRDAFGIAPGDHRGLALQCAALTRLRRWKEAAAAGDRLIAMAPNDFRSHAQRAGVDAGRGRVSRTGMNAAREAVRLAPNSPEAHVSLGNVWAAKGKWKEAQAAYGEALRIDPSHRGAAYSLAIVKQRAGRFSEPVRLLLGLIRANPAEKGYLDLLRGAVGGIMAFAGIITGVTALLAGPNRGAAPRTGVAIALAVGLTAQVVAFVLARRALAPVPLSHVLLEATTPVRRRLTQASLVLLAVADLLLVAALVWPSAGAALCGMAAVTALAGSMCVVLSIAQPRT